VRETAKIAGYQLRDIARSRWLFGYVLFFLLVTDALLRFGGGGEKALLSLMNVVLFVIPLVTLVFSTVYLYNAREFIELLLAQPIRRHQLFGGLYLGLVIPLSVGFAAAVGLPFVFHRAVATSQPGTIPSLLLVGMILTFIFTAIAFFIVSRSEDRLKGLGIAIATWLLFGILYDGLVLLFLAIFADHPIERPVLGLMLLNPIDLARVALLLQFDVSALLGYTGAVLRKFFETTTGLAITISALVFWIMGPVALGLRAFQRKDF